ncbi:MAG: hypothetical protein P9L88_02490 [Candidatus Tantalella remota]|nr:hypothetical protein [Candidatus Tantalella remota]
MNRFLIIVLSVMLVLPAQAGFSEAQSTHRLTHMQGNEQLFSVDLSDLWNIEMQDGDIMGISDDGMIWFFLGDVPGKTEIDESTEEVKETMDKYFTDIEVVRRLDEFNINGLMASAFEGTAKENGKDVEYFVMLFKTDEDSVGVLAFVMDPAAQELLLDEMVILTKSVSRR